MTSLSATVLAHGVGSRTDLPLSSTLAVGAAVWAVFTSFVALAILWPDRRVRGAHAGRPLPAAVQWVADSVGLRLGLRLVALLAAGLVVAVAFAGPSDEALNAAPYALYVTFWVGLVPLSLLLGPVWRLVNPLRLVHSALSRSVYRRPPTVGARPLPAALGWWPAAGWLGVFVWLELVPPFRSEPAAVGTFLVAYAVVNLYAAAVYGSHWFDRGDGFEAMSTLFGALSPLGRRADGRFVVRNPIDGACALRAEQGLVAVVMVLIGSTAFDGLTRTRWWIEDVPSDNAYVGTLGLLGAMAIVTALYLGGMAAVGRVARPRTAPAPAPVRVSELVGGPRSAAAGGGEAQPGPAAENLASRFAASLVPIAAGYAIAHYLSLLVFEGQRAWILASDPFGTGADLFGVSGRAVDYTVLSTTAIGLLQVGAIVAGHVVAVLIAHQRAVTTFAVRDVRRSQYPLMAVMILLTGVAVALLVST